MIFTDAGEWKVRDSGAFHPNKRDRGDKRVSSETDRSVRRLLAAASEKPAWLNNLSKKSLSVKTQAAIEKEMDVLPRADLFKPLKKAAKVGVSLRAGAFRSLKKTQATLRKEGYILVNVSVRHFTLICWKCYLDSCVAYRSFFIEEILCNM